MDIKVKSKNREQGFALVATLMLLSISLLIVGSLVSSSQNNTKMQAIHKTNLDRYYDVERTLGSATAWFQDNQAYLAGLFEETTFHNNFNIDQSLLVDHNDPNNNQVENFSVPSSIRVSSSSDYPILSNNADFGTASFPNGNDGSGGSLDLVADFSADFPNANNDGVNTKIILLGATEVNLGKDSSGNDIKGFSPIFRVDAITGNNPDRGTNLYSYVYGAYQRGVTTTVGTETTTSQSFGFYGNNGISMGGNSDCKSKVFSWDGSNWTLGADAHNCIMQSYGDISLSGGGTKIYGAAMTNKAGGVSGESKVTNNNADGCEAVGCHVATFNNYTDDWLTDGTCSSFTDKTISSDQDLTPGCYGTVTIANKKKLTLVYDIGDSDNEFYIKTLNYGGGKSELAINLTGHANPEIEHIKMFVNSVSGNHINGNRVTNETLAPSQLQFIYTGSSELTLNGRTNMRAHLYAPYADIKINGNFSFYGGINAKEINTVGTANLYSDEIEHNFTATSTTTVNTLGNPEMNFVVTKINQRYR